MPSLKALIPAKLQSHVVYETTCPGCNDQYIGQTKRHLATRLTEHSRIGAPLGDHFRECIGSTSAIPSSTKIDRNSSDACLLLLEAIHISQETGPERTRGVPSTPSGIAVLNVLLCSLKYRHFVILLLYILLFLYFRPDDD